MSKTTTLYDGRFVLVDMVDETIELTVDHNVYSRTESHELLEDMKVACRVIEVAAKMGAVKND
jgi:hypothetical protein